MKRASRLAVKTKSGRAARAMNDSAATVWAYWKVSSSWASAMLSVEVDEEDDEAGE